MTFSIFPANSFLHQKKLILTDAQVKVWPTVSAGIGYQIVAAPGANKFIYGPPSGVGSFILQIDTTAGAYANVDNSAFYEVYLRNTASTTKWTKGIFDQLTYGAFNINPMNMLQGTPPAGAVDENAPDLLNTAMFIALNNNGLGNLTNGNVANRTIISVSYYIFNIVTGQFE